jgi:hypothetical protein
MVKKVAAIAESKDAITNISTIFSHNLSLDPKGQVMLQFESMTP